MASPFAGTAARPAAITAPVFQQDRFIVRQRAFIAPQFHFLDLNGNTLAFVRKTVFTWKDEIRVFTDETQTMELLHVKARKITNWGTAFDVTDSINQHRVGALKRLEWRSLVSREWAILDANDQELGKLQEGSLFLATLRRYLGNVIPQSYKFEIGGRPAGIARRNWNVFAPRMEVDFSSDPSRTLDRRLATAAVVLLMAIDGRQSFYD